MTDPARVAALEALVGVAVRLSAAERLAPRSSEPALRAIADAAAAALHVAAASIALHVRRAGGSCSTPPQVRRARA